MSSSAGPSSSGPTAGAALAASRGIYAQPLPSSVMFPIRSVVEPSASLDGVIYEPKPVVYITWKAALVGAGVGVFGATFQVRIRLAGKALLSFTSPRPTLAVASTHADVPSLPSFCPGLQNAYFNRGKEWLPIFTQYGRTIGLFSLSRPLRALPCSASSLPARQQAARQPTLDEADSLPLVALDDTILQPPSCPPMRRRGPSSPTSGRSVCSCSPASRRRWRARPRAASTND